MNQLPDGKRYRVVQWATGNVGLRALRRAIEHPSLDLVGLWVHSPDKVGRDAGELAGIAPIGVKATNSIEDVIALKPDCVLYMPHIMNYDEVCRLLASGANIVTTRTEFQNSKALPADILARVEAACLHGNSSIHGTGSSPGFITEAMPIVLASIQRRIDCISIDEFADNTTRNSPEMLFEVMGFGKKETEPNPARLDHLLHAFGPSLELVADALGLGFDDIRVSGGLGLARKDVHIAAGVVPAGTVAAMRTVLEGMRNGKPLMRFTATWFVSSDVDTSDGEQWDFRDSGWRVRVEGDCPLNVGIRFPVKDAEDYAQMTPGLTAHRPINVVPYICEAPAGIQTTVDLPQIIAQLG
ncbi:MAG TPA: dihydrodipicolinate reductase [Sphingobium sp.]|uniref:NAD(P)H-dependent amine dehydrogenase family protein n=1 Tax=Sphingobium sp. TaxID=1912891 RepID=UPI002ED320E4